VSPIKQPPPLLLQLLLQVAAHPPAQEEPHTFPQSVAHCFVQLSLQLYPPPPLPPPLSLLELTVLVLVIVVNPDLATAVTLEPDTVKVKLSFPAADTASLTYYRSAKLKFCCVPSTCLIETVPVC